MSVPRFVRASCALLVLAVVVGCAAPRPRPSLARPMVSTPYRGIPVMRVLVVENASPSDNVSFSVSGACTAFRYSDSATISDFNGISPCRVSVSKGSVYLGNMMLPASAVEIVPHPGSYCSVDGVQYDGNMSILTTSSGGFNIVNAVDLESYVKGVIVSEVSQDWPPAALQAQAIAARTYALWKMESGNNRDYDLVSTVRDQAYSGRSRRQSVPDQAADDTLGSVLLWKGRLIPAYYHSSSGGYTENAYNVWHTFDIPPLAGREVPYSAGSPHSSWKKVLTPAQIELALRAKGMNVTGVKDVIPDNYTRSGRPTHLRIVHSKGELRIGSNDFRLAVGPGSSGLKSTKFRVHKEGANFVFIGSGYGHGVGMDQYAVRNMALEGMSALDIVTFFYPEVEVLRAYR
ncbi:MAG: SpoIID/LytB domain-containing protein [Planctomycetota bacterium]